MFEAVILDCHNLFPKLAPHAFKSIDILEGDGGDGTLKRYDFGDVKLINTVIIRFEKEVPTAVASSRMFKAYILDSHNLLPKLEHLRASSSLKEMEVLNVIDTAVDFEQSKQRIEELDIMGVFTVTDEYTSPISPARLFKALIVDSHNLIPKLMPQAVKSIEIFEGDGGAGSIRQINVVEGNIYCNQVKCSKNRVDALDLENFSYKYSLIEGDVLMDKLEKISYDVKFEPTADGGSKNTMTSTYYTKGNIVLTEEEIKEGKEKSLAMYKVVENYLMQNPEEYA
ncbi:hypothetical protein WN943_028453 [Citrus x changshan-huyou]